MKIVTATVISAKQINSAVVLVESSWKHPVYQKKIIRSKKYLVHNSVGAKEGDLVEITSSRPLSARKHFTITKIIKK
jgi:small subunit ribosomal protein S17